MNWLISANSKIYDHASSFEHHGVIDWKQNKTRYQIGDTVYIYCTKPAQRIRYKCEVTTAGIPFNQIRDDKEYWLDEDEYEEAQNGAYFRLRLLDQIDTDHLVLGSLIKNGLKAAPQGPKKLSGNLLEYIESIFQSEPDDHFPDTIPIPSQISEGLKKIITVNKYERSSVARALCIEHNGALCKICGFDFEKVYGALGKNFIHIHHITPIHSIGKEYKIDYRNDLTPVCPNCHAMLHRKINGAEVSIAELKQIVRP